MAFFTQWFPTVFLSHVSSKEGTKEMIGESLGSHFSPEIMKLTKEHDIKFITLHSNSSHLFQPLVVADFKITQGQLESYSRLMEKGNKIKWSFSKGTSSFATCSSMLWPQSKSPGEWLQRNRNLFR